MTKIVMKQGTSRTVNLTFLQSDGSTPIDLTGGKVYFTVNQSNAPASDASAASPRPSLRPPVFPRLIPKPKPRLREWLE
jgi:hypothetical protein